MNKEYDSVETQIMAEEQCNHSDMGSEGDCPDCGKKEEEKQ